MFYRTIPHNVVYDDRRNQLPKPLVKHGFASSSWGFVTIYSVVKFYADPACWVREAVTGSRQRGLRGFCPLRHERFQFLIINPPVFHQVLHQPSDVRRVLEHLRDLQPDPDEAPGLGQTPYIAFSSPGPAGERVGFGKIME